MFNLEASVAISQSNPKMAFQQPAELTTLSELLRVQQAIIQNQFIIYKLAALESRFDNMERMFDRDPEHLTVKKLKSEKKWFLKILL